MAKGCERWGKVGLENGVRKNSGEGRDKKSGNAKGMEER